MQHPGKESPDLVEHHRLDLNGEGRRSDGFAVLDGPTRAMLHQLHWRQPPREPWRFALALTVVLLLHIMAVFVVRYEMRPGPVAPIAVAPTRDNVIELRLIDAPRRPPAAPAIEPPPELPSPVAARPVAPPAHREPSANNAIQATVLPSAPPAATSAPTPLRLFAPNGSLLPAAPVPAASAAPPPDYVQQRPRDDDRIMRHDHPVKYKATRFEKDWAPNMDILDNAAKRVMDATMIKQDVPLPGGGHLHCSAAMMFLPVGCKTDDPPAPPKKDGDVRMNMAPTPLVKDLPPSAESPPVPTEAECIAIYRKGDPLPQGCAPDTPIKAIDQEQAARKRVP